MGCSIFLFKEISYIQINKGNISKHSKYLVGAKELDRILVTVISKYRCSNVDLWQQKLMRTCDEYITSKTIFSILDILVQFKYKDKQEL